MHSSANLVLYRLATFVHTLPGITEIKTFESWLNYVFKFLKECTNITPSEFFTWSSISTRSHIAKLYYPDSRVTVRQHFFSVRIAQLRNKLPEEVVSVGSVSAFISRLCRSLMHCLVSCVVSFVVSFREVISAISGSLSSWHCSAFYCLLLCDLCW